MIAYDQSHYKTQILGDRMVDREGHTGTEVMCLCFEVLKGTHWWWHSSPEWDNRDLLTQHLGALPSPIKTYKPSFTHCEWPACHSTHSLLIPLPTTLIYSHHRSPVLSLSGECKHTGRCRGHLRPMCSLIGPHSRKPCVLLCLWMCVRVCVFLYDPLPQKNHNRALPRDSHVFWGNEHNGVFSVFVCLGTQWYVTYCTLDKVMKEWMQEFFLPQRIVW